MLHGGCHVCATKLINLYRFSCLCGLFKLVDIERLCFVAATEKQGTLTRHQGRTLVVVMLYFAVWILFVYQSDLR